MIIHEDGSALTTSEYFDLLEDYLAQYIENEDDCDYIISIIDSLKEHLTVQTDDLDTAKIQLTQAIKKLKD